MAYLIVSLLLLVFSGIHCIVAEDFCHQKFWKADARKPYDWKTAANRRVPYQLQLEDKYTRSYAYCAAELVAAAFKAEKTKNQLTQFSGEQIYDALENNPKAKQDIDGALDYVTKDKLYSTSRSAEHKIAAHCTKGFTEDQLKQVIRTHPACVELSVPKSFLSLKPKDEEYDCAKIKEKPKDRIKYTALAYGYDTNYFYIKTSLGEGWAIAGYAKLANAAKCGITSKVSYTLTSAKIDEVNKQTNTS